MIKPLLEKVMRPGVSDIHLKANEAPLVRYLGQLSSLGGAALTSEEIQTILQSLCDERLLLQFNETGNIDFSYSVPGLGRLRVNAYRQRGTMALAMRIIPLAAKSFAELNLPGDTLEKLCQTANGLILVTGVTGAGKTTTMNAMVNYMNERLPYNIIAIEDPIEFFHTSKKSSISQREVGLDVPSFTEGLKFVMRQDPDVIVIGELRTVEAMATAIDAAASGHLVLATLHGTDVFDAFERVVNKFDSLHQPYMRAQMANVFRAIIGQRLIADKNGKGCYPATEIALGSMQLKKLLLSANPTEVRFAIEKGTAFGMHTFDQDLLRMVEAGQIVANEALSGASNANDLRIKLQGQVGSAEPQK